MAEADGGLESTPEDLQHQNEDEAGLPRRHEGDKGSYGVSNGSTRPPTRTGGPISFSRGSIATPDYGPDSPKYRPTKDEGAEVSLWSPDEEPIRGRKGQIRILSEMRERLRRERLTQDRTFLSIVI